MNFNILKYLTLAVLLSLYGNAQSSPAECPSKLGERQYGHTTYKKYFCEDHIDPTFTCTITSTIRKVHRSVYANNVGSLNYCSTEFCLETIYYLNLVNTVYPLLSHYNFEMCVTVLSVGDNPSKVNTGESQCISSNSHVIVDTLSLEEQIPLIGMPFYLNYSSDRFRSGFSFSPQILGLGGWLPSIIHRYDSDKKIVYFGYGGQRPVEVALFPSGFYVSDDSGDNIFYFDSSGKHIKTRDALTGAVIYEFIYDSSNRISQIKDRFSNITSFTYQANKVILTSPYNENSELNLNTSGMLSSFVNPNGESFEVTYSASNQMASFQRPMGQKSIVTYDSNGFVVKDQGAGGDFINLIRASTSTVDNQNISLYSAMGNITSYSTLATDRKSVV